MTGNKKLGWGIAVLLLVADLTQSFVASCPGAIGNYEGGSHQSNCNARGMLIYRLLDWIFCIIKSDDNDKVVVAVSTVFIAIFTWRLFWATKKLWESADGQVKVAGTAAEAARVSADIAAHSMRMTREFLERAYLSGGGGAENGFFGLTIQNYGRMPGVLQEYALEFCSIDDIPEVPAYLHPGTKCYQRVDVIQPGAEGRRLVRVFQIPPDLQEPVVYGRFWYTDIWRERRYFSFILAIRPPTTDPDIGRTISDEYNAWN